MNPVKVHPHEKHVTGERVGPAEEMGRRDPLSPADPPETKSDVARRTERESKKKMEGVTDDQFPNGLRVLVVDDNVLCLHLLEKMLRDCSYQVTKCQHGVEALALIRENRGRFDIVLTDVHMPGMDGLQLLAEIASMDKTLPVVMFSSDDEKDIVAKGVKSGACDFLVKPIQITTLKILWRHVLRSNPSLRNNSTKELGMPHTLTTSSFNNTHTEADNVEENSKSLKRRSQDEADQGQTKSGSKKPRIVWTPELNQMFIMAVNNLGDDNAKPRKILQIMRKMTSLPHLTRQHVSSHLQKYRRNTNKIGEDSEHQSVHSSLINGPAFANLTRSTPPSASLIGCGDTQNNVASSQYAASSQYPSQAISITGCDMRMPNLVEFPSGNVLLQSQPFAQLHQPNLVLQKYRGQQQADIPAQCLSDTPASSIEFNSPMNDNTLPILRKAAAARDDFSAITHPLPLHSHISAHDIRSLSSSTPASELGVPIAFTTFGVEVNESCGSNIKEFCYWNNNNPIAEELQVYSNEDVFTDMLDQNLFEDLGFGEHVAFRDSYIWNNSAM